MYYLLVFDLNKLFKIKIIEAFSPFQSLKGFLYFDILPMDNYNINLTLSFVFSNIFHN